MRTALALTLLAACGSADGRVAASLPAGTPLALLPSAPARNAPSFLVADASLRGERLADVDACEGCHVDVATQWRASAHSFASFNNPVYRTVVEKFRTEVGQKPSRFCGGCHDVALVLDAAMDAPVATSDARAQAGINCRVCHGVTSASVDGNGSVAIGAATIPVPTKDDPASIERHRAALHRPVRSDATFCGGCHRAFLNEDVGNASFLVGQDDFTPWARSAYAGSALERVDDEPVAETTCQGCHMPLEPAVLHDPAAKQGMIHSHRFLGGHTWMSAMRGDADQLGRAAAALRGALSVDVFAAAASTPARPVVDVVVRNRRVGHRFPGGVMDAQDSWLEVTVRDAAGHIVASSTDADGMAAHRFRSLMLDEHGMGQDVRETNRFRVAAWNHTIAPRDAVVVEYAFDAPAGARGPWRVDAALRHRSRDASLQQAACADARGERGRAFAASSRELLGTYLDPCQPQPVTEIAQASVVLGDAAAPPSYTWRQHFAHALGLGHAVSERLDEARVAYEAALATLPADAAAGPHERAAVLAGLAQTLGKQGRIDDALARFDEAERLWPDHPAIPYLRGEAYAAVWRWSLAAPLLARAAALAPRDDLAWSRAAVAYQSAGQPVLALAAARRGLEAQPRSADLLRIQALALPLLGAPVALGKAALDAWVVRHPADDSPRYRSMCQKRDPDCARERIPVHVHELRTMGPTQVPVTLDTSRPRR